MAKANSENEREVIAVFSVVVKLSKDESKDENILNEIARRGNLALETAFDGENYATPINAVSYVWVGSDAANVFRCDRCGRLYSAENLPNLVHGLPEGIREKNSSFCLECRNL